MVRAFKSPLSFGATAIVAGVLIFSIPKVSHAAAALLVQVTNTAATPAISQDVSRLASQAIILLGSLSPNSSNIIVQLNVVNSFENSTPYVVPPNQSLVINTIEFDPQGAPPSFPLTAQITFAGYQASATASTIDFTISPSISPSTTTQLQFQPGIVLGSGGNLLTGIGTQNWPSNYASLVTLTGYLTNN